MSDFVEAAIQQHLKVGDLSAAVTAAVESYGTEIYKFLIARMSDPDAAYDVFGQACEDIWTGIGSYAGRSSFKTWFYVVARNAAHRHDRSPHNQPWRHTTDRKLETLIEKVRTETAPYERTEVKEAFRRLREELSADERTLLVLRVNRAMAWNEIVCVMSDDEELDDDEMTRLSARMRQRFTALKKKLEVLARDAGLLDAAADHVDRPGREGDDGG